MVQILIDLLFFLGGTPEAQKQLIQRIQQAASPASSNPSPNSQQQSNPKIANSFALGYTFVEFKDQDHDGMKLIIIFFLKFLHELTQYPQYIYFSYFLIPDKLSHLDIYTLPSQSNDIFLSLLEDFMSRKLLRGASKPLLISILVDWNDPLKTWARNIASWIKLLKRSLRGVDKSLLEKNTEKSMQK